MRKSITLFLVTSAFTTSLLFAQGTPPTPVDMAAHRVQMLTRLLGLTPAQVTAAEGIYTVAFFTANESAQASLKGARQKLQGDIEATPAVPQATLQDDVDAITKLENTLAYNNAVAEQAFYAILTPAQQTTFSNAKNRGPFGGRGGFPGGGGFRGGPH